MAKFDEIVKIGGCTQLVTVSAFPRAGNAPLVTAHARY